MKIIVNYRTSKYNQNMQQMTDEKQADANSINGQTQEILDYMSLIRQPNKKFTMDNVAVDNSTSLQQQQAITLAQADLATNTGANAANSLSSPLTEISPTKKGSPPSTKSPMVTKVSENKADLQKNIRVKRPPTPILSNSAIGQMNRPKRPRRRPEEIYIDDFINKYDPKKIFDILSKSLDEKTILEKYKEKIDERGGRVTEQQVSEISKLNSTTSLSNKSKNILNDSSNKRSVVKPSRESLENCNKEALLKSLINNDEIDAEMLLEGYREKKNKNKWTKKDIREEASKVLDIDLGKKTTKDAAPKTHLKSALVSLSNCFGDNFVDAVMETFGGQFNPEQVLEVLKSEELKNAILRKFSAMDLLDLFRRSDISNKSEQVLETISIDHIAKHIQSKTDLQTVELMLNVLLENFSQIELSEVNQNNEKNADFVNSDSEKKIINGVVNLVKYRKNLKTSERLFNVLLQNGPKTDETKKNIKNFLKEKFSASELNDLTHEVISYHLAKKSFSSL